MSAEQSPIAKLPISLGEVGFAPAYGGRLETYPESRVFAEGSFV